MTYYYRIADLCIQLKLPCEINIGTESEAFITTAPQEEIHELIDFEFVPHIPYSSENGHWEVFSLYTKADDKDVVYHCDGIEKDAYARLTWSKVPSEEHTQFQYNKENNVRYSHSILNALGLENLLLRHNGLILHSSFIRFQNQGILFSAPSGTGKSTQADLWHEYEQADIINGDRAALRKIDHTWYAYGLPYAGSSGIYKNEKAPVKAIVLLKQADENKIRKATITEALSFLYPEFTIHRWDNAFSEKALDLILDMLKSIPVYILECRPDKEAVEVVKNYI